ncbi:DUF945 family protein [Pseudomonas sp. HK3]
MKKSIIIPAVLLTAVGITSPYIMGLVAENQFTSQLETLSVEYNSEMFVSDIHFNRGYAKSDASFVMTFADPSNEIPTISILFESNMQHAPVHMNEFGLSLFEIYSQDRLSFSQGPEELIAFVNENMGGYILSGYSRANVLGSFDSVLSTTDLDFSSEAGDLNIQMDSVVINSSGQIDGSETLFDIKLPSTNIESAEFNVKIDNLSTVGDRRTDTSGIELGSSVMEVAQLSIVSAMGEAKINNMTLSAVSDLVDNKVDTNFSYIIESIESPLPVSSASYKMDVNGLSMASALLIQDLQQQLDNMEINPESVDVYFNQLLTTTFQPGLHINQELKANAFGGDWLVELDVEYTGVDGVEIAALADPKVAIKAVAATMVVTADNNALLRTPIAPMVDGFLEQGLIKLDNTNVISVANLTAGKLTVNELEIPVEPLIDALLLKIAQSQEEDAAIN